MDGLTVLLQHGEKVPVPGDPDLTRRGAEQARAAAQRLVALRPGKLVSSPLLRARATIAPLAEALELPVTVDVRLHERTNLALDVDPGDFARAWARSTAERGWRPPYGRSSEDTARHMLSALDDHRLSGGVTVLGVHGGATVDLLRTVLGDRELELRAPGIIEHGVPAAAVTTLEFSGDGWQVRQIADVSHLPPERRTGHHV